MSSENVDSSSRPGDEEEQVRLVGTRREFVAGAGAGLAVGAVVAGGIAVATRPAVQTQPSLITAPGGPAVVAPGAGTAAQPSAPAQAQPQGQAPQGALPLNMR